MNSHVSEEANEQGNDSGRNDVTLNDFLSEATFFTPRWIKASLWIEHIPFAFWLVGALKPRVYVELGTHKGTSYAAFCQAVQLLGTGTQCNAVDTWAGDPHAGFYDTSIFDDLNKHNAENYAGFSRLLRCTFDEALDQFEDGTVDLLHIDGFHTFEAVKHDFETWLPKLSSRAVVLFHDTQDHTADFGVYKLWSEMESRYPTFEFHQGNGLGVVGIGSDLPEPVRRLFLAKNLPEVASKIRAIYAGLGRSWGYDLAWADRHVKNKRLAERKAKIAELREEVKELRKALDNELKSRSWFTRLIGRLQNSLQKRREKRRNTKADS